MKTFYRDKDGHTYFIKRDENCSPILYACPTNADNTPDFDNYYCVDSLDFMDTAEFESGFTNEEANQIRDYLCK